MLLTKSILAKASGLDSISAKDKIKVKVDYCLVNDGISHESIEYFKDDDTLYNNGKSVIVIDHNTPSGSVEASVVQRKLINFAKKHNTTFYNGQGIGYELMLNNHIKAGQIVVSSGVHTSTLGANGALSINVKPEVLSEVLKTGYLEIKVPDVATIELTGSLSDYVQAKDIILNIIKSINKDELEGKTIEFCGDSLKKLTLNDKVTLCNLSGKTGAFSALINDQEIIDNDCHNSYKFDLCEVTSLAVMPDSYDQIVSVDSLGEIKVNEVFIGGCSGGGIEDLRAAANIVRGKKAARGVRLMIAPKTSETYIKALQEGLITDFLNAGAIVMNQGCSVCYGKSQGIIDKNEVLVSAGSYNCRGCAGSDTSKIYITSAKVAAVSAINGKITNSIVEELI